MSNDLRTKISKLVVFLLRLGATSYVFAVLYPFIDAGLKEIGNGWRTAWLLIILVFFTGVFFLIVKKKSFYQLGFVIVLLFATVNTTLSIVSGTLMPTLFYDFFVITICLYFLTRRLRMGTRKRKQ